MKKIYSAILLLSVSFLPACDRVDLWNSDALKANVSPPSNAWLSGTSGSLNSDIVIQFSGSMDTATLVLGGTMAGDSNTTWSLTSATDDTLTISAGVNRTNGAGATLTLDCSSLSGKDISLNLTYNVTGSLCYVNSTNPGATLTGTRDDPMSDIQTAVSAAVATASPGRILIAAGTYSTAATLVTMEEGISLYGGYSSSDWSVRNSATYISLLQDTRTTLSSSNPYAPQKIISVPAAITSATVIDGFSFSIAPFVSGASSPSATAILIDNASPVISNNVFTSPDVSGGSWSHTIGISHVNGGSPEICNNTFSLGARDNTASDSSNYGIYCYSGANAYIHDNIIDPGASVAATGKTCGIFIQNSSPTIENNSSIKGGTGGSSSIAVYIYSTSGQISTPTIKTNTITAGDSDDSSAIAVIGTDATGYSMPDISDNLIEGGTSGSNAMGIVYSNYSSGSITNNRIIVSGASAKGIGVYINSASPLVAGNYIQGGNTGPETWGIQIEGTSNDIEIYNNAINAGGGTTASIGVEVLDAAIDAGKIYLINNTINGRSGTFAAAVQLASTVAKTVNIYNNNLFTGSTTGTRYGIYETNVNAYAGELYNNNFFQCAVFYYDYIDGVSDQMLTTAAAINAFLPDGSNIAVSNISENIYTYLDSSDEYRFSGDATVYGFSTAGVDASTSFTVDRDAAARTINWSIGAYEYD